MCEADVRLRTKQLTRFAGIGLEVSAPMGWRNGEVARPKEKKRDYRVVYVYTAEHPYTLHIARTVVIKEHLTSNIPRPHPGAATPFLSPPSRIPHSARRPPHPSLVRMTREPPPPPSPPNNTYIHAASDPPPLAAHYLLDGHLIYDAIPIAESRFIYRPFRYSAAPGTRLISYIATITIICGKESPTRWFFSRFHFFFRHLTA